MVLKTLNVLGPLHGYGIAKRILLKLEQEGSIASEWGSSENNRRARFYRLTRSGHKQLRAESENWETTTTIIARFFAAKREDLT